MRPYRLEEQRLEGNNFPFLFTMRPIQSRASAMQDRNDIIEEAIRWCAENFGEHPQGTPVEIHRYLAWKAQFRFRTEKDAAAFKLRWG